MGSEAEAVNQRGVAALSAGSAPSRLAAPPQEDFYGEYDENGVDLSLLRYMLRLSPVDRLKVMDKHARDTQMLYDYGRRHREAKTAPDR